MMNLKQPVNLGLSLVLLLGAGYSHAYESGSTGVDGVFNPVADVEVPLPPDGIFNYISVIIPAGVTVTFQKNATNTPVTWLVQQDAVIDGTVDVSADFSMGGPGGFNGGKGATAGSNASPGLGPGGGESDPEACHGTGAGYALPGTTVHGNPACTSLAGSSYGREEILPLIGGSGGGGGSFHLGNTGTAGGGGGGAILIAASDTITVNGAIRALGGAVQAPGPCGGKGSGGAIKLVASVIDGEGAIDATTGPNVCEQPVEGSVGRIRLEAESLLRVASTTPPYSQELPGPIFVPNFPAISISMVGGVAVPANPTGLADVEIPPTVSNPINVEFSTFNVPLGEIVTLAISPFANNVIRVDSNPITGTEAAGTATVAANLPNGSSTLMASVTFTVDSMAARQYAPYAEGGLVAKIRSSYQPGIGSITTFITEDGREFDWRTSDVQLN